MSRILLFSFSIIVIALGATFSFWLWKSYCKVRPQYEMTEVTATIEQSNLQAWKPFPHSPEQFYLDVKYSYHWNNKLYQSTQVHSRRKPYLRQSDALADLQQWQHSQQVRAWIDPQNPEQSLLVRDSKAMLYAMTFPIILLFFGIVTCWRTIAIHSK